MKVIEVIPILRGIGKDTLSYFTGSEIKAGSLVKIPLRKKIINGIVISSKEASEEKTDIKLSPFPLRKVEEFKSEKFLSEEFMKSAEETARYHAGTLGSALAPLLPKAVLENFDGSAPPAEKTSPLKSPTEIFAYQAGDEERRSSYKSLIREEFAKKRSVFISLSHIEDAKRLHLELSKGVEEYCFLLHSSLPKKKLLENWNGAVSSPHPVLVLGTGSFLGIPRRDIKTIIIEKENSRAYKSPWRPFIDFRIFAETYAKNTGARLIFADSFLRVETVYRAKTGELMEFSPLKWRTADREIKEIIADMKKYKIEGKTWNIFSPEMEELISENGRKGEKLFIFGARRGLQPATVCRDCGNLVYCERCGSPAVLHSKGENDKFNFFACHKCGRERSAAEVCKFCGSWRLLPLGGGTELIKEEIRKKFSGLKVFEINKDKTKTDKEAKKEAEAFFSSSGGVLIGTEMALPYLYPGADNAGMIGIDSLFAVPDFRIDEKIVELIVRVRSFVSKKLVIQTRAPDHEVFKAVKNGGLMNFYQNEIRARGKFGYPPFKVFIKAEIAGGEKAIEKETGRFKKEFAGIPFEELPLQKGEESKKVRKSFLIRTERPDWPDRKILGKLLALPPYFTINVNPDSLL